MAKQSRKTANSTAKIIERAGAAPGIGHNQPPTAKAIDRDVLIADAMSIVRLWDTGNRTMENADARAIAVIVRAHEADFFAGDINVATWHQLSDRKVVGALMDTILNKLFGLEKSTSAYRQRLTRIRYIVPAMVRCGGTRAFKATDKNGLMVSIDSPLFKASGQTANVTGTDVFMALNVQQMDKAARKMLEKESPKLARAANTKKMTTLDNLKAGIKATSPGIAASALADSLTGKTRSAFGDADTASLQHLLVLLIGVFATDDTGEKVDHQMVDRIYNADTDNADTDTATKAA